MKIFCKFNQTNPKLVKKHFYLWNRSCNDFNTLPFTPILGHTTKWSRRVKVSSQVFNPKNQSRVRVARSKMAQILATKFGPNFFLTWYLFFFFFYLVPILLKMYGPLFRSPFENFWHLFVKLVFKPMIQIKEKRLKTTEKNSSTSFWVPAAPKSWSKYTTYNICNNSS